MTHSAVTGSTGFIGRSVLQRLAELNAASSLVVPPCEVLGISRRPPAVPIPGVQYTQLGDLSEYIDWAPVLLGVDVLVHTAARAHVMADTATNSLVEFRRVNVQGTIRLAQHAAEAGVQRFVFLSSIGVNGNQTTVPFNEAATPQPHDAYAVSKLEAEQALFAMTIPSKLQTYLSAAIPVVAMLNGEGSDVVRESGSGITCGAGDHEGLAKAVLQLSQATPEERLEMGRKGRELSQREFDRDTLISRLEGWMGELCSGAAMSTEKRSRS